MRRDHMDPATTRHLLQRAAARRASQANTNHAYSTMWLLHATTRLWCRRYDREVRVRLPAMSRARCAVLTHLAQNEGVNQAALAECLGIRSITLARLLDRMEAAGLIRRVPDPDDRLAHLLTLTAKALPIIECIYDMTRKIDEDLHLGISEVEAKQLRGLLCRIRANLTGHVLFSRPLQTDGHA
jgi:DNA-binding MarR family transcriptional regulator